MPGSAGFDVLAVERSVFQDLLPSLGDRHAGEFVLIKNREVIGFYPTSREAYRAGQERFGISPFLIALIEIREQRPASATAA